MNGWINFAEFTFPMKVSGWIWPIALIIFLYSVLSDLILILLQQQRTVYRLTLVKAWNVEELQAYSELVSLGKPDFIEVKVSCWLLGDSPNRECHPCGTVYLQKWMLPVVFNRWWMRETLCSTRLWEMHSLSVPPKEALNYCCFCCDSPIGTFL